MKTRRDGNSDAAGTEVPTSAAAARPALGAAAAETLPARSGWLALASFMGAVVLNVHHTAPWCLPLALGAAAWRVRAGLDARAPIVSRSMRAAMVIVLTAGVLAAFRTLNGTEAGASLLVAMASLKLTEVNRRRDWLIVLGATLFLMLAACLDAQALWRLPFYALQLWLLATAVYGLKVGQDPRLPTRQLWRRSGLGLAAALPLTLVLFVLFPRLSGSLWALPQQKTAMTGLGDEMSPGSITQLTQSDEPALRVRFRGPLPPPDRRYWRGPVLHTFNGVSWRRRHSEPGQPPRLQHIGASYGYQVTLEPNEHNVLIALEMPLNVPDDVPGAYVTSDYQLINPQATTHAIIYQLDSWTMHHGSTALADEDRLIDLQLPPDRNPRSVELAHRLRAASATDGAYVAATLDYLRRGGFSYTLTPPALGADGVDDLLFSTRQGFCGHYASAFAFLMRAAGVPARVVTGYLGGEWNEFGDYLLVRQADAHAWNEVWLDGSGWVRIDPTAVLAPARLTHELDSMLP